MAKKEKMKGGCLGLVIDIVLTVCTGGLYLIYRLVRYLRAKS